VVDRSGGRLRTVVPAVIWSGIGVCRTDFRRVPDDGTGVCLVVRNLFVFMAGNPPAPMRANA